MTNDASTTPLLTAEHFARDPRVLEARRLLGEALAEHRGTLTGVRPPISDPAKIAYADFIARFQMVRGGKLFYPYLGSGIGNGALVELADGSVKYDMISGIGVHYFGHSTDAVLEAGLDAALSDTLMQGNLQQNTESVEVSEKFVQLAQRGGSRLCHCVLSTSGAMANENALKMALQKNFPASRILAFEHCFMGRTLVLSQVTDRPQYREGLPTTIAVDYVPYFDPRDPEGSIQTAIATLQSHLDRHPKQHAAMVFELVQGEGGYNVGTREFFVPLMEILKEKGIAVMADEIQTFGRTSAPFAFDHFGLGDYIDLASVGKMSQVCATLFAADYKPRPGLVSQTFTGSTSQLRGAERTLDYLASGPLFGECGRVLAVHQRFVDHFERIAAKIPGSIRGPYGYGGMIAFTPFDGSKEKTAAVNNALFEAGVIAFVTGSNPTRTRFLPPLAVVTDAEIDGACEILESTLANLANGGGT